MKHPDDLQNALFELTISHPRHASNIEYTISVLVESAKNGLRHAIVYPEPHNMSEDEMRIVISYLKRRRGIEHAYLENTEENSKKPKTYAIEVKW